MLEAAFQFFFLLAIAASLGLWGGIVPRWRRGEAIWPYEPRTPAPWGAVELLANFCLFFLLSSAIVGALAAQDAQTPEGLAQTFGAYALASTLTALACTLVTRYGAHATWSDLGYDFKPWLQDVRLGALAYLAFAPPVYLIQGLLTRWLPYKHPTLDDLQSQQSPLLYLAAALMVVAAVPWVEELVFRVLLQGWLERIAGRGDTTQESPASGWPIVASAAAFALMHASHGPAPIPLFVLGLGLGYVYRQTHRLLPSVVMHGLFNGTSMAMFAASAYFKNGSAG